MTFAIVSIRMYTRAHTYDILIKISNLLNVIKQCNNIFNELDSSEGGQLSLMHSTL